MNPYTPPPENVVDPYSTAVIVGDNHVKVSGEMVPWFLPMLGQIYVSVNGGEKVTSKKIRWHERIEFELPIDGQTVQATLRTVGAELAKLKFQILVNEQTVAESNVKMKRGWIGLILGIVLGMGIAATTLAVVGTFLF